MEKFNVGTMHRMWDSLLAAPDGENPDWELYLDAADALHICLDHIEMLEQLISNLRAELQRQRAMEGAGY